MPTTDLRRPGALLVIAALATLPLAGCAAEPAGGTIQDSKGASQLIRNIATGAVGDEAGAPALSDGTVACASKSSDPDGIKRWWRSLARYGLSAEVDPEAIRTDLVDDLVAKGWTASDVSAGGVVQLTRDDAASKVTVATTPKGAKVDLTITVDGPCVETDGAESEEVLRAEGRWVEEDEEG
jgi:hypothetical protein